MNADLLKIFSPAAFFILWVRFALRVRTPRLIGSAAFFASFVALSQNFSLIYRELYQLVQAVMIVVFIHALIKSRKIARFNSIFIGVAIFILISLLFHQFDVDAKVQTVNFLVSVLVVNCLYYLCGDEKHFNKTMSFVVQVATLEACIGIFEYLLNLNVRAEGTFANPNYFGLFLGVAFCIAYEQKRGGSRILTLAILLAGILVSGSRAGFLIPALQILWASYRSRNALHFLIYSGLGVAVMLALVISGVTRVSDREASESSDAERIIFARIALRMANDNPFAGVGWGRYVAEFGNYSSAAEEIATAAGDVDVSKQERRVTHNDLVRILAELGWVAAGLSVFTLLVGSTQLLLFKNTGLTYIPSVWLGVVLFSFAHNNLNGAFFWFFFVMPFHFSRIVKKRMLAEGAQS